MDQDTAPDYAIAGPAAMRAMIEAAYELDRDPYAYARRLYNLRRVAKPLTDNAYRRPTESPPAPARSRRQALRPA